MKMVFNRMNVFDIRIFYHIIIMLTVINLFCSKSDTVKRNDAAIENGDSSNIVEKDSTFDPYETAEYEKNKKTLAYYCCEDTISLPLLYWAGPISAMNWGWMAVVAGEVVRVNRELIMNVDKAYYGNAYLLKIEKFICWPDTTPKQLYLKTETFAKLKIGNRLLVFILKDPLYIGTVAVSGTNSEAGVLFNNYNDKEFLLTQNLITHRKEMEDPVVDTFYRYFKTRKVH
jgi:hypothetical protein